ncbi:MAG TPA: TetR/AcrR family transcriptional regulator [Eudoraea sp.]|nr:TetR/AcrR family transcriptional regulator [Eudoraea sp.]
MKHLFQNIKIGVNKKLFVKDPDSTDLGKRIVENSILLIHEMGFEQFTFKKLGARIGSNESSVYRYFENKHKLLLYLTSWYWGWLEYQLVLTTNGIPNPEDKLKSAIEVLTQPVSIDTSFTHINEVLLSKIVINEYSKSYLIKEVDKENKEGYFEIYKRLILRMGEMIIAVNPDYAYPHSLSSTILEGSLHQYFLQEHFPSLTDCDQHITPTDYLMDLAFHSLSTGGNG